MHRCPSSSILHQIVWITAVSLAVAFLARVAEATDYYVATNGWDGNFGTSLASPFLTIQQAANVAGAGDNIYVRGGTYRETVRVKRSGTESAPITFQPYGSERVTVTGLDVVAGGWSVYNGSTYQCTVQGGTSQLFVNGKMMTEARSANSGYTNPLRRAYNTVDSASIQNYPNTSTITSANLGNPSNGTWAGAKMAVVSGAEWVTQSTPITGQTGNSLNFQWSAPNNVYYNPAAGNRFYLYGSVAAVDSAKEYYYDSANSKLYFNSSVDPNLSTVEVRTRDIGFELGTWDYINVSGFQLLAAGVNVSGGHNRIDNCQILYPTAFADPAGWAKPSGVNINGTGNTVSNSEIAYSWGSGIAVRGSSNTVDNNLIHDVNWSGNNSAAVDIGFPNSENAITNNTIYNAGRSGILCPNATAATITHNEIARFGVLTSDLGGVYTGWSNGGGTVIAYNNIHDCDSHVNAGVYLDSDSSNYNIHHNVIANVQYGVVVNATSTNETIRNNTFWGITERTTHGGGLVNSNTSNNLSNEGTFLGNTTATNLSPSTSPFVNAAAGDYTLQPPSSAIDGGTVIPCVTDGYSGSAPDIGAFEYGVPVWTAGASFKTWLAGDQTAARLAAAATVTESDVRTTAGSLIAGKTGDATSSNNRSFLKFDVSNVAGQIHSAVLRLYENTEALTTDGVSLYVVTSAWDPDTVSYDQSIAAVGKEFYDADNLDLYTDIDIMAIVQGWINDPSSNYGLSLRSNMEGQAYAAKYFEGMYGICSPQLIITAPEPSVWMLLPSAILFGLIVVIRRSNRSHPGEQ